MEVFGSTPHVVIITGAAGATGRAIAQLFFDLGASLCLVDILEEQLSDMAALFGDRAISVVADIAKPDSADRIISEVSRRLGPVDVLVNNAGVLSNNKAADTNDAEWQRVLGVNLNGAFFLSRAVLPMMRARSSGRIINVCSLAMKTGGITAGTAYAVSKGGLASLTYSLARECAAEGITVNGVAPAYVRSPMVTEQLTDRQRRKLLSQIPVGRFCEPAEVAHVVAFLASDHAGFITGEIIDINGGLHMD
jgi:3-oxoacyl-[acyl-carrier protein] reductase